MPQPCKVILHSKCIVKHHHLHIFCLISCDLPKPPETPFRSWRATPWADSSLRLSRPGAKRWRTWFIFATLTYFSNSKIRQNKGDLLCVSFLGFLGTPNPADFWWIFPINDQRRQQLPALVFSSPGWWPWQGPCSGGLLLLLSLCFFFKVLQTAILGGMIILIMVIVISYDYTYTYTYTYTYIYIIITTIIIIIIII
jgi:hypothetical protein